MKLDPADIAFSLYIRTKADFTCDYCGRSGRMETSHFHGRRKASTRFDEENVSCLCFECHHMMHEHPNVHTDFFKKRLGSERYEMLNIRAEQIVKVDRKEIKEYYKKQLKVLEG